MGVQNPYAPPHAELDSPQQDLPIAGLGARLLNLVIDSIARVVVAVVAFLLLGLGGGAVDGNEGTRLIVFVALLFGYYIVLEYFFGRTLGKLITGTRVVNFADGRPSLLQIVGRTFLRLIPFEPFSVLFSKNAHGWHDWMSGTRVVRVRR